MRKRLLGDFTEVLRKRRTPKAECTRAHIVDYPRTPEIACSVIDGFAERVYGSDEPDPDPPFSTADIDEAVKAMVLRWNNKSVRDHAPIATAGGASLMRRVPTVVNRGNLRAGSNNDGDGAHSQYMQSLQQTQVM